MGREQRTLTEAVERHLEKMRVCARPWKGVKVPLATPEGERYPLVYPRDMSAICRAWDALARKGLAEVDEARTMLEGAASFLLEARDEANAWGQRYDLEADDRSLYPQEDNIAHGVTILARHVCLERETATKSEHESEALQAIGAAVRIATERLKAPSGLFRSTTAIHESAVERGKTLWTNGAFHQAFRLAAEAARRAGDRAASDRYRDAEETLGKAIQARLVRNGRFIARRLPDGTADTRPDITLLSPYYFGFHGLAPDAADAALHLAENALVDPAFGLLRRYLPDPDDPALHLHGGDGPYLAMSAWLAQAHATRGSVHRARDVLGRILSLADQDGDLAEHVATADAFERFVKSEWMSGEDLHKEFDTGVLLPGIGWEDVLEESLRMVKAYKEGREKGEHRGDGIARIGSPHAWTHAECAVAAALIEGREGGWAP